MQNPPPAPEAAPLQSRDPQAALDALRARGAERIDPLRFHFLQTLAARAQQSEGELRRYLDMRFGLALKDFDTRIEHAEGVAVATTGHAAEHEAATPLAALAELRRALDAGIEASASADTPIELKSVRYFGDTWAQLSIERQIGEALQREPDNAGPLNSHLLVLRALTAMRELSPAYLKRFMIYADALLSMDSAIAAVRTPAKPAGAKNRKRAAPRRPPTT